jgi:hypothetical protein
LHENRITHRRHAPEAPERAAQRRAEAASPEPVTAALLAIQRSAGNRAAGRLLARSPLAPPGPVGDVNAVREIALGPAAGFEGYETEQEGVVAAGRSERVGVVVADDAGRFHAYETDLEPIWGPLFQHVKAREVGGGRVVRWTHLDTPGDAGSYTEQIKYAERLARVPDTHEQSRRLYLDLLTSAVGLDPSDVHDSSGGEPLPGKVSFDLTYTEANAHAGIVGKLPSDRKTVLPQPTLELGPGAFDDVVALRATLLHEFAHVNHAVQAIEAVERWRATTTDGDFLPWLGREQKAGRIDAFDFALIKEQVQGGTKNTEALGYVISFTAAYDSVDLTRFPEGDPIVDLALFGKLIEVADQWMTANHAVQDHVIAQLVAYRDSLDAAHRDRLVSFVTARHDAAGATSAYRLFWGPLR